MNSTDVLQYAKNNRIPADKRKIFFELANYLFERELFSAGLTGNLVMAEVNALEDKKKLEAVKLYKNRTGCSLMEGKLAIEAYMQEQYGCVSFAQNY